MALPPDGLPGFTQPASPSPSRARPNRLSSGGGEVARNEAYVTTQPTLSVASHSGTSWNDPPTGSPSGTPTPEPRR